MEARLFWISIGCGLYGLALRHALKTEKPRALVSAFFHALFTAAAMGLLGMLASSYMEKTESLAAWSLAGAVPGFLMGFVWAMKKSKDAPSFLNMLKEDLEWADTGFSAILLASIIMYGIVQAFKIPSGSMRMTFLEGDHLFVNKFIYGVHIPLTRRSLPALRPVQRGDIVIFRFPSEDPQNTYFGKDFIKRVIGLPGDTIEIRQKTVYVNGRPLVEPYTQHMDDHTYASVFYMPHEDLQKRWQEGLFAHAAGQNLRDNFGPVSVPPHHFFVMGDNRDFSFDSRFWGPLPQTYIKGRAWLLYWPLNRAGFVK